MINKEEIRRIAIKFTMSQEVKSVTPFGSGNINDTYLVNCDKGGQSKFILQRLNSMVFSKPEYVVENMRAISDHFRARTDNYKENLNSNWEIPEPLQTSQGDFFLLDDQGSLWRAMTFLDRGVSFNNIQTKLHAFEIGRALGKMHDFLHDLDPAELYQVIPGFHETPQYLQRYKKILKTRDGYHSDDEQFCHDFIKSKQEITDVLDKARRDGELCLRPIHGDPKISNILVDPDTYKAVGMVDLDTVGPGLIQYDIGDCLRSCCNPAGEESVSIDEVDFDLELCETIMNGYYGEVNSFISKEDRAYFFDGLRQITFELGLRFLIDHLEGNIYFKVNAPTQNIQRAMRQFRLVEIIESNETELRKIF